MDTYTEKRIKLKRLTDIAGTVLIVFVVLMFCISMTIPAKASHAFGSVFDFMMFVCIILGIGANIFRRKEVDRVALILTLAYFVVRFISYIVNSLPVTYGGSIMLQMFYLIGINRQLINSKKKVYAALYAFLAFDVVSILLCHYICIFKPETAARLIEPYVFLGGLPESCLFQNPNYAGMMSAAAVIVCVALIINRKFNKIVCLMMIPAAVLSLHMLFTRTSCRSGQLGLILTITLMILLFAVKRIDSIKWIVSLSLIACILLLVPVGVLVYHGDNEKHISDSTTLEMRVDLALTGRYALWKTTMLSQKGRWLFGYGNNKKANKARREYVEKRTDPDSMEYYYWLSTEHTRQHNGYVALVNEAGLIGALAMMALLLYRIKGLKGRFRDGNWEKILLVYLFWINVFEAKFLLQQFFTGLLIMILLMPDCEEENPSNE